MGDILPAWLASVYTYQVSQQSKLLFLRYHAYTVCHFDLCSLLITTWPSNSNRVLVLNILQMSNVTMVQASLLKISYLQGFAILTELDCWPWLPPKMRGFLYSMWYTHITSMKTVTVSINEISQLLPRCHKNTCVYIPLWLQRVQFSLKPKTAKNWIYNSSP